ncbi:MAG: putative Ribosomal small subunit methyltransferase [Candidatus Saccharibacteria bacterium]|nr:putative Ribosomal small subunit methyltransferase [Candidatus Saccharibacteria bacterium]
MTRDNSIGPVPKKSLGQHWLNDEMSLHAMLLAADVQPEDTVLEIGPGLGPLTALLVDSANEVIAVEFDEELARGLPKRVPADNLRVVRSDILRFDLTTLKPDYKVVANIPYYLTSKLVRVLSESPNPPLVAALLVQKEVAERLAAKPGQLSILGVTSQYFFEVSLDMVVKAELFTPPPKVDSQIVVLKRRPEPLFPDVDTKDFFRLVKAGFGEKRKTLLNSLSAGLHMDKESVRGWLEAAGINPMLRAQNLSIEDWYKLYQVKPSA